MSETGLSFLDSENASTTCGLGVAMILIAFACAIVVGISPLLTNYYVQANAITIGILGVFFFGFGGGYLMNKGFTFMLRKSQADNSEELG